MPNMRPGFGKEKLLELCGLIEKYANKYGTHGTAFLSAIAVVKEYERVHESMGYAIDTEVKNSIQKIQLQYALHLQKIGCCILNWYALPKDYSIDNVGDILCICLFCFRKSE